MAADGSICRGWWKIWQAAKSPNPQGNGRPPQVEAQQTGLAKKSA